MATEKLNVIAWDAGWPTGFVTNIDEPIASADGQNISTTLLGDVVVLDFNDVVSIHDIDIVTVVVPTIRCRETTGDAGAAARLAVELLIGGVAQGGVQTVATMSAAFNNDSITIPAWDVDWTVAQLNTLQLRITTTNLAAGTPQWAIDAVDIDITYTVVPTVAVEPLLGTLTLTGVAPTAAPAGGFHQARPAAATLSLSGESLVQSHVLTVPVRAVQLRGRPSYLNPLTVQLQPSGWSTNLGWINDPSNIDEPVAGADGQVMETDIASAILTLEFPQVTGIITDQDDVLGLTMLARVRANYTDNLRGVSFSLYMSNVGKGLTSFFAFPAFTFINQALTPSFWSQDWTTTQLNSMQVRVTAPDNLVTGGFIQLDALDVYITYSPQSPVLVRPPGTTLGFSSAAPGLHRGTYRAPAAGALALTPVAPTFFRVDLNYPSEETLLFSGKAPKRIVNFVPLSLLGSLALSGKAPSGVVNHLSLPSAESLALSGKVPTSSVTGNKVRLPARRQLTLAPEVVLLQASGITTIGGSPATGAYTGQAPVAVRATSVWKTPAKKALTLTRYAPSRVNSKLRYPAVRAATLSGKTPSASTSVLISPDAATISLTPQLARLGGAPWDLLLTTYAPAIVVSHLVSPASTSMAQAGFAPWALVNTEVTEVGRLTLTLSAPRLVLSTFLYPGVPELISLTVNYDIEFIATPTVILLD